MSSENRRPLASRDTSWAKWLAQKLVERNVSPDEVSLASMLFAGVAGFALAERIVAVGGICGFVLLVFAVVGIQGRLLCNLLDGMIAIEGGKSSPVGDLYNEVPDRVSDVLILVGAGYGLWGTFPCALGLGVAAALLALLTAYIRALGAACGTPHYFLGPMAKPHRMACLTAACVIDGVALLAGSSTHAVGWALLIIVLGSAATCVRRLQKISETLWALQTVAPAVHSSAGNPSVSAASAGCAE